MDITTLSYFDLYCSHLEEEELDIDTCTSFMSARTFYEEKKYLHELVEFFVFVFI